MLSLDNTRYFQYTEKLIANDANATSIVEGSPLVLKIEDGLGKVGLPTGAATDKFVGVAFAGFVRPSVLTQAYKVVVDANQLKVALPHAPLGNKLGATVNGAKATISINTGSAAAGAPKYTSADNLVEFVAEDAGKEYVFLYTYEPTVNEARFVAGDGYPGGFQLSELAGTIGVIHQGQVATDQYDVAADWSTAATAAVKLNADGKFTIGGDGAEVANARVLAVPGVKSEYLVLQLL